VIEPEFSWLDINSSKQFLEKSLFKELFAVVRDVDLNVQEK
jgi:hypothetical protein